MGKKAQLQLLLGPALFLLTILSLQDGFGFSGAVAMGLAGGLDGGVVDLPTGVNLRHFFIAHRHQCVFQLNSQYPGNQSILFRNLYLAVGFGSDLHDLDADRSG